MVSAKIFAATALVAGASAKTYPPLDTAENRLLSARALAYDAMALYNGNRTGGTPGLLRDTDPTEDPQAHRWWHGAAFLAAIAEYSRRTGDTTYDAVVAQGLLAQAGADFSYKAFLGPDAVDIHGNDDQCHWAQAVMLAAEAGFAPPDNGRPAWLRIAQGVFDMQAALFDYELRDLQYYTCGGGIRTDYETRANFYYKDTLTNACFLNLGARLAKMTGNDTYARYAEKTWDWLWNVDFINHATYAVYHGASTVHNCTGQAKQQNSGSAAYLSEGAALMYNFTKASAAWQDRTQKLTDATLGFFFPNGVAVEIECEGGASGMRTCYDNDLLYKGMLHRGLATAAQVAPFVAAKVLPVLTRSAAAALAQCTGDKGGKFCGFTWANGTYREPVGIGAVEQANVLAAVTGLVTERPAGVAGGANSPGGGGGASSESGNGGKGGSGASGVRVGAGSVLLTGLVMCVAFLGL